jgi:O-antigen biosynthesis protein
MLAVRDFLADQQVSRRPDSPASPAVSVILPTFQRRAGGLLQKALDSVLSQSFADFELIVVDDGSVDGTRELIAELQRQDERVVHIRHDLNCGLPALRVDEGIELARGRWIAFQFDDDEWLPGGLAALVQAAEAAPEPSLVFGRADWYTETWRTELPRVAVDRASLHCQNEIANNSVLVPRRLFEIHGLYDPHVGMRRLCDWDLWLRLLRSAELLPVDRLVSRVPFVSDATAIGVTAPVDLSLARYLMSIPRDAALGFGRWRDYEVDGMRVAGIDVPGVLGERLEREHLRPFRARFRDAFPHLADRGEAPSSPRVLLCAYDSYDAAMDLGLDRYDAPRGGDGGGGYQQVLHPVGQLGPKEREGGDMLLFLRTTSPTAAGIIGSVVADGLPAAYYLDESAHLHEHIGRQLAAVDAVWSSNPVVSEAVRRCNPRVVPHHPYEAACRATALHAATRQQRIDGMPRILYFFASGVPPEIDRELLQAAVLVRDYGFAPHAICVSDAIDLHARLTDSALPWSPIAPGLDSGSLRVLFDCLKPARVHTAAPVSVVSALCAELGIPLIHGGLHPRRGASELLALY